MTLYLSDFDTVEIMNGLGWYLTGWAYTVKGLLGHFDRVGPFSTN